MRRLKKYQSGEAAQYITRRAALRKLQLSLKDFRRLCIIKGVYPREPKHRRRAQKGSSDVKILYHAKDIRFLLHEPLVWTLRDYKIFAKKTGRDRAVKDFRNLRRRLSLFPELRIDHIVKERYPTFLDALKDLDDCLTLLFLFSLFPSLNTIPRDQSFLCRRLTMEFLHYIICTKSIRKVFISIKGFYFQADIRGQKVTWILPHNYPFQPHSKAEVDFKLMSIFVEFYTVMLGFVNYRLYNSGGYTYPPIFGSESSKDDYEDEMLYISDRIAALNCDLFISGKELGEEVGGIDLDLLEQNHCSKRITKMRNENEEQKRLITLFKGLKFFISREVPREPLVILIRSFGGKVSWDSSVLAGATYNESDHTITHQIAERFVESKHLSRDYVQPQWVFDSVNRRCLLPTNNYFVGVPLPPHFSPFADVSGDSYLPSEERLKQNCMFSVTENEVEMDKNVTNMETSKSSLMNDSQLEFAYIQEKLDHGKHKENTEHVKKKLSMSVKAGKVYKENKNICRKNELDEHRLKARMVKSRHRNLFRKLIREQQLKEKEKWLLKKKRGAINTRQPKKLE